MALSLKEKNEILEELKAELNKEIEIYIEVCKEGVQLPTYATEGDAGMDIRAAEDVTIYPNETKIIPTGLKMAIPEGYEIQVRSRSGIALKQGLMVTNGIGTIDESYKGDIGVILTNTSKEAAIINQGDRIAQLVLMKVEKIDWNLVSDLNESVRGEQGFGHSGIN